MALTKNERELAIEYSLPMDHIPSLPSYYHVSGFTHPELPLLCMDRTDRIVLGEWGLVPFWASDYGKAIDIREKTLNARAETIWDLPSFKYSVKDKRCLVIVDGFYEPHEHKGQSWPFFCFLENHGIISLAGLYSDWDNPATGEQARTFTIITVEAVGLMLEIHNKKKRMPVILNRDQRRKWLDPSLVKEEINDILRPLETPGLTAHPVTRDLYNRRTDSNTEESQKKIVLVNL